MACDHLTGMLILQCRKEVLRLLRKMCKYVAAEWLVELCSELGDAQKVPFTVQISEVLAVVLENEVCQLMTVL